MNFIDALAVRMTRLRRKLDVAGFSHDALRLFRAMEDHICALLEPC